MDKLSERLWIMRVSLPDLEDSELATLDEAIKQIERYEGAPVAELYHVRHERNQYYGELYAEDLPDGWEPAYTAIPDGQRVRILLDTEGG
jgi:hypothetical protein